METNALDPAVLGALPPGCTITSVAEHGKTNWSKGFRVDASVDGQEKVYFLKLLDGDAAATMAEGEYESQKALEAHIPGYIVHPSAWGNLTEKRNAAFYLADFITLRALPPPIAQFLGILKKLHQSSTSPNGKFGFHVTTFYGASPMRNEWTDTWEEFFIRELRSNLEWAQQNRGRHPGLDEVTEEFVEKVIPRLLRPLETGGRRINPTLCHGDLWDENIQIDVDRKRPIIFDGCCFYGHNEMDLQCMRDPRYALGPEFIDLYKKEVGVSEPKEDFDDRNALYSMRNDILTAGMWPRWASLLQRVKEEMLRLLEKHPLGFDGFQDPDALGKFNA